MTTERLFDKLKENAIQKLSLIKQFIQDEQVKGYLTFYKDTDNNTGIEYYIGQRRFLLTYDIVFTNPHILFKTSEITPNENDYDHWTVRYFSELNLISDYSGNLSFSQNKEQIQAMDLGFYYINNVCQIRNLPKPNTSV